MNFGNDTREREVALFTRTHENLPVAACTGSRPCCLQPEKIPVFIAKPGEGKLEEMVWERKLTENVKASSPK